ncbi:hypothetical protein Vafri_12729, partial [Volvox africanus]
DGRTDGWTGLPQVGPLIRKYQEVVSTTAVAAQQSTSSHFRHRRLVTARLYQQILQRLPHQLSVVCVQMCNRLIQGLNTYWLLVMVSAPEWINQASESQCYNSAFQLSDAAVRAGLAQLGLLQAAQSLPTEVKTMVAAAGLSAEQLGELRQAALDQARATATAALDLYTGKSGLSENGVENKAINAIRELMKQLERLTSQGEMAEIAQALMVVAAAEYGSSTAAGAMQWLSGHLYRCPNGHPYVIGNCGGAMERALCPECGQEIGGINHALQTGNARATDVLENLQLVAPESGSVSR